MKRGEIDSYFSLIKQKLFFGLTNAELRKVLDSEGYAIREVEKDALIFCENDCVRKTGVVLEGELIVQKDFIEGSSSIFDILHPCDIFGLDIALTKTGISTFSVVAGQNSKILEMAFKWEEFLGTLPKKLADIMTANIIKYISDENIRKQRKIEIISQNGLRKRIMIYLEFMRKKRGREFAIQFSREQLANYLCVNRSKLSYELGRMRDEGLLKFNRNRFVLLDKWNTNH